MIYTLTLLGIYILSVLVIYGVSRFRPHTLWRLHPILIVALFSFVPAVALGREMLLRTELWKMVSVVPSWLSIGLSALFVVGIIPVRSWIRKEVLERTAEGARQFLDSLPERMMSIEAAESREEISAEEAAEQKTHVQRAADRVAAIHGVGRLLYLLLKLHLVGTGIQAAGGVAIALREYGIPVGQAVLENSTTIAVGAVAIIGPLLVLLCVIRTFG
ncbi:MAG: FHIPEP family type III secretion protein [Alkalispirochaeta sp.]